MNRLVLPGLDARNEKELNPRTLKGLTVIEETRGGFKRNNYSFPEFGPARYLLSSPAIGAASGGTLLQSEL